MNDLVEFKSSNDLIFNSEKLHQLTQFAQMMAKGKCTVPNHLSGNPGDCLAITMQAAQWGMNPFAVAQKTHIVSGTLGYEAQLVNAVISSSTAITGRFHYEYIGDWDSLYQFKVKNEKQSYKDKQGKDVWKKNKGWKDELEKGLAIKVGAVLKNETEITWLEPLYFFTIDIRNSPNWVTDPRQQIAYLAVKKWSRLYTPAVILGVYTSDELPAINEPRDITPKSSIQELNALTSDKQKESVLVEYSIENFQSDMQAATTPEAVKHVLSHVKNMQESDKSEASKIYKLRLDELKAKPEVKISHSTALIDALEIIEISQSESELIGSLELSPGFSSTAETDIFQAAYDKKEAKLKGGK